VSESAGNIGVLFDLDGTLVDSLPAIADAMSRTMKEFGHEVTPGAIVPRIGAPMQVLVREMTGVSEDVSDQMYERYLSLYYEEFIEGTRPLDYAEALLERLATAGAPMGVVTNKNEHGGKLMVEIQGWQRFFKIVVGRDTTARPKPWPDGPLHALEALNLPPEQAALVGDTEFDMRAARDAELRWCVGVLGARDAGQLKASGATHVASDLETVGNILLDGVAQPARAAAE
jgi:HAD superfamily hydrolase (TIGR01509 family)